MQTGQRADWPLRGMRNNQPIVCVDHIGHFPSAEDPAHMERLDVKNANGIVAEKFRQLVLRGKALARRDGNAHVPCHFDRRLNIAVMDRLLKPGWTVWLQKT